MWYRIEISGATSDQSVFDRQAETQLDALHTVCIEGVIPVKSTVKIAPLAEQDVCYDY